MYTRASLLLPALVLSIGPVHLHAQTPLQPTWVHTWPFGQAPAAGWHQPPSGDNHVEVDPTTGLVYCTVSDVDGLVQLHNELLYSFDHQGSELTPAPVPVLSAFTLSPDVGGNGHSTTDIAIHGGQVAASHLLFLEDHAGWNHVMTFGPAAGQRRHMNPGIGSPVPQQTGRVATDADHLLLYDGLDGLVDQHLYCMTAAGWPMWMEDMTVPIRDIALHQGIVYLGTPQAIQRRVVSNGNPLTALPAPGASDRIVVHGNFLHHAGLVNGTLRVVKTGLDGTLTWSNDLPLGPEDLLTGCVVDGAGRTWVSVTLRDPIEQLELGGRLFCLGTDGGLLETFAYGTTINGIATDGTYLFATGWSTNTISETYLIGVLTDVVTAVPARDPSPLRIWPQPTNDRVHVVLPSTAQQLQLVDAAGHTVCSWPTNGALRIELGVAGIAAGSYVLHVITADGLRMAEPLLIQR